MAGVIKTLPSVFGRAAIARAPDVSSSAFVLPRCSSCDHCCFNANPNVAFLEAFCLRGRGHSSPGKSSRVFRIGLGEASAELSVM